MRAFAPLIVGIVLSIVDYSRSEAAQAADPAPFDPIASVVMHPRCMNCGSLGQRRHAVPAGWLSGPVTT